MSDFGLHNQLAACVLAVFRLDLLQVGDPYHTLRELGDEALAPIA